MIDNLKKYFWDIEIVSNKIPTLIIAVILVRMKNLAHILSAKLQLLLSFLHTPFKFYIFCNEVLNAKTLVRYNVEYFIKSRKY